MEEGKVMGKISTFELSGHAPLVVDLDGTLTSTDTLVESIFFLLKKNPLNFFILIVWLFAGRAEFKRQVAKKSGFSAENLPLRKEFVTWLHGQHQLGRDLILATAAHKNIADQISKRVGLFSKVISTENGVNLKGAAKLEEIRKQVGLRFSYAGDSKADLPIWDAAETAILVGASGSVRRKVSASGKLEAEFLNEKTGLRIWMRALRVHQWLKNLLIFVPLLVAFAFNDSEKLFSTLIAFFSFSLAASATYIFNDLWDLESDRKHVRKSARPFASTQIPILHGVAAALILLVLALGAAFTVSISFAGMVITYIVLTSVYSLIFKNYVLIDVLMLALLYTFRVLAGSVAAQIHITQWLLAFSIFTFFGLALVKRCAELKALESLEKSIIVGRDYQVKDLAVLWPLGVGASLCSVVVFGLYIGTPTTISSFRNVDLLWLVGVGLLYWNARLWIKTVRGEMHDDPIVFAARDFGSRITLAIMIALTLLARFLN